jgi:hypothetical protein
LLSTPSSLSYNNSSNDSNQATLLYNNNQQQNQSSSGISSQSVSILNNNSANIKLADEKREEEEEEADNIDDSVGAPPREVGHNLYILAHKLSKFNKELSVLLKSKDSLENEALVYYAAHTAQIEIIREDRAMEQIVFPVPTICEYLTKETKQRIFLTTKKDEQNSKFFRKFKNRK